MKPITIHQLAEKYQYFLFDMDGVLWWCKERKIGQAFKNLEWLESQGKQIFFVTNSCADR